MLLDLFLVSGLGRLARDAHDLGVVIPGEAHLTLPPGGFLSCRELCECSPGCGRGLGVLNFVLKLGAASLNRRIPESVLTVINNVLPVIGELSSFEPECKQFIDNFSLRKVRGAPLAS